MDNEFTLKFNKGNNFDSVAAKYDTRGDRLELAKTVAWLINNAENSIENCYGEGAPRLIEMRSLCNDLRLQLRSQLSQDEIDEIRL